MPSRNVYHVVPADERWGVRLEGAPTLAFETDDRDAAVERASGYVRQLGEGRVVVHGESGQIETVHTFDRLPPAPSSWSVRSHPVALAVGLAALVGAGRRAPSPLARASARGASGRVGEPRPR